MRAVFMDPFYHGSKSVSSPTCEVFGCREKFRTYGVGSGSGREETEKRRGLNESRPCVVRWSATTSPLALPLAPSRRAAPHPQALPSPLLRAASPAAPLPPPG